jgi:PAS domain S-box-containing protein
MAPPRVTAFRPELLWQQAREPMFWLDPSLRVAWVNRAWEELTGHPGESVLGLCCTGSVPADSAALAELVSSMAPPPEAAAGVPSGTRTLIVDARGARHWRRLEFWPFRSQAGELLGMLGQVRDAANAPSVPESRVRQFHVELLELRERLRRSYGLESLIGSGPAHRRLLEQIRVAARTTVPVLIVGEPGTGKRLVARIIHQLGASRQQPLIPFDCAALPADELERLLFVTDRRETDEGANEPEGLAVVEDNSAASRLSLPEGSSLLIGDILAMPRDLQSRLAASIEGNVRVFATTAGNLEAALESGTLRADLYHALTVLVLRTSPLREQRHDLPVLSQHLLDQTNQRTGTHCAGLTPAAIQAIQAYDWPGNMRELARVIDVAHARAQTRIRGSHDITTIELDDLPATIRGHLGASYLPPPSGNAVKPLDQLLTEIERRLIETALTRARRNKSRAAELLGISRPRLYRRIKELSLPDDTEPENGTAAGDSPP